nr:ATP-binding protein [Paraglaciecola arctica]
MILVTLVLLLLSQVFLSRNSQSTFVDVLDLTQQAVVKVGLVRELERDVIDLQRNVLIYKESASGSAIRRFDLLIEQSQDNLKRLESLISKEENNEVFFDYITRMRSHLYDYKENFSSVVAGRSEQQTLYNSGLSSELETLFNSIKDSQYQAHSGLDILENAKYHIARAEILLLQYLQTPDQQLVEPFQQEIMQAKLQINKQLSINGQYQAVIDRLSLLENNFLQLTQITRGYLFLVNVVMAGTANEFLFLARELDKLVTEQLVATNMGVKLTLDNTSLSSNLFSAIGIILAIATALFLAYKIMLPINTITSVFQRLALGKDVKSIPSLHRRDEIGQLAKAADVFRKKNQQTATLLQQSQSLNAQQEALNSELVASKQKVEQATASKSMFLANMSHEIRTPMNGIIGMLEIVLRSKLTESQREQLTKAAHSGQILMSLINDILDFSKIEAGKLDIESTEFSVESLFANVLANIGNRAQEKNLNVRFNANPNMPAKLIGDPLRISQVLLNLCSNAVKFTRNGHISINVDFQLHDDTQLVSLFIEVTDSGIGMTQEQVSTIFDSFTQADGSTSRKFGGSGLGLSIVTQLVELMGGSVTVNSEENKGSTFKVNLLLNRSQSLDQVMARLPAQNGKLYYFSAGRKGFFNTEYIEKSGLNYHHFPQRQMSAMLKDISCNDTVLLDIEDQAVFRSNHEIIDKLFSQSIKVGFVTDSQPSNLPKQLLATWPAKCLSHPFTPQQASTFLKHLVDTNLNAEPADIISNHNHQTTLSQYEGHILLVEDNSINQAVASEMLKLMGLTYDIAENGYQAVTKIVNSPQYDLVLMDIQMPVMDGYEATRTLRQRGHNDLIICGLSANAMKQDYAKAKEAGMDDYIVKPIKQLVLEDLVAKYLPKKSMIESDIVGLEQ